MILNIKHKGLRIYWETGSAMYLNVNWLPGIHRIMTAFNIPLTHDVTYHNDSGIQAYLEPGTAVQFTILLSAV